MAPGICAAFSAYMLKKALLGVPRDTGIKAAALTEENIDKVHVDIVAHRATIFLMYDHGARTHLGRLE